MLKRLIWLWPDFFLRFKAIANLQCLPDVELAISEACRSCLRSVLLTSVTLFAGLMPLLGEFSRQAQFLIPAAVSLAYGIMFATIITLKFIPCLLMIQNDIAGLFNRNKLRPREEPVT
jgi:multidrug efflux pump subunit AcrB